MRVAAADNSNSKVDDSLVHTRDGHVYSVSEVVEVDGETQYKCHPVMTAAYQPDDFPFDLPWSKVGILKYEGICLEYTEFLSKSDIVGKCVICDDFITLWRVQWIMSRAT